MTLDAVLDKVLFELFEFRSMIGIISIWLVCYFLVVPVIISMLFSNVIVIISLLSYCIQRGKMNDKN